MSDVKLDDFMLLVSTTDQLTERSFLEELFKSKNQVLESNEITVPDQLCSYPFKLDNKYYNADIKFVTFKDRKQPNANLVDQTEALGILFDIKQVKLDSECFQSRVLAFCNQNFTNLESLTQNRKTV